jgi:hypothetical protein
MLELGPVCNGLCLALLLAVVVVVALLMVAVWRAWPR